MTAQKELARQFFAGTQSGDGSNVAIQQLAGGTAMVGYGHAVYAFRYPSGHVIYFHGWQGYSRSTNSQLGKMGFTRDGNALEAPSLSYNYRSDENEYEIPPEKFHVVDEQVKVSKIVSWLEEYTEPWL